MKVVLLLELASVFRMQVDTADRENNLEMFISRTGFKFIFIFLAVIFYCRCSRLCVAEMFLGMHLRKVA